MPSELPLYLLGALPGPHDRHEWHTSQCVFPVTGSKFINWTRSFGGGGPATPDYQAQHRAVMEASEWPNQRVAGAVSPRCQKP
jgi:hypothetical protein